MNRFFPEGILYERADNKEKISSAEGLKEAEAKKTILEGRVSLCDFNHNLFVDLPAMKGIIPREEGAIGIKEGTVRDIALISRVSHPVCFTVTGVTVGSDGPSAGGFIEKKRSTALYEKLHRKSLLRRHHRRQNHPS